MHGEPTIRVDTSKPQQHPKTALRELQEVGKDSVQWDTRDDRDERGVQMLTTRLPVVRRPAGVLVLTTWFQYTSTSELPRFSVLSAHPG